MRAHTRQAVSRLNVHTVDASVPHQLAQAIQARTSQRRAAVTIVDELSLSWHPELIFHDLDAQGGQLIGDGSLVRRGASVQRRAYSAQDLFLSGAFGRAVPV